jgi:hypothetical protein
MTSKTFRGPGRSAHRIGFTGDVPDGAAGIIETLRSYCEEVEVFDDQKLTEQELLAANLYLTAAAQKASATPADPTYDGMVVGPQSSGTSTR